MTPARCNALYREYALTHFPAARPAAPRRGVSLAEYLSGR